MYMSIEELKKELKDKGPDFAAGLLDKTIASRKTELVRLEKEVLALEAIWSDVVIGADALVALQSLK